MAKYKKKRALLTPDLTPLIDVVFLLLIFFIVSSTFNKYGGISIELPTAKMESVKTNNNDILEIIIDKNNKYFINYKEEKKREISFEELDNYLKLGIKNVAITGDKDLKYQNIIDVVSKVKKYGIENLGINFYE